MTALCGATLPLSAQWFYSLRNYQGGRAMDRTVARLNIEHFRRLIAEETDEMRRQLLQRLLAEEEAKLTDPPPPDRKHAR